MITLMFSLQKLKNAIRKTLLAVFKLPHLSIQIHKGSETNIIAFENYI